MQKKLAAKGRHMVTIVDPHIKRDDSFRLHKEATEKGYYVKDASGKDFDGWCWPGSSSYLDMVNPEIRSWWGDKFSYENYVGSTPSLYIWNDMNEPSVCNGPEVCSLYYSFLPFYTAIDYMFYISLFISVGS
jgi:alpha 1,3-glucosidase